MNKERYLTLLVALQNLLKFVGKDAFKLFTDDEKEVANELSNSDEIENFDKLANEKLSIVLELVNRVYQQEYERYKREEAKHEQWRGIRRGAVITGESSPQKGPSTSSPFKIEPLQRSAIEAQKSALEELEGCLSRLKEAWSGFVKLEDDYLSEYLKKTSSEYQEFIHYIDGFTERNNKQPFEFKCVIIPQVFNQDLLKSAFKSNGNAPIFEIDELKNAISEFYPNSLKGISQESIKNKTLLIPYAPTVGHYVLLAIQLDEQCQVIHLGYYDSIEREEDSEKGNPRAEGRNGAIQTILGLSYFDLMGSPKLSASTNNKFTLHAEDKQSRDLISLDACAYFVIAEILRKILREARNALHQSNISGASKKLNFAHLSRLIASVFTHQSNSEEVSNTLFLEELPPQCQTAIASANEKNKEQEAENQATKQNMAGKSAGEGGRDAEKRVSHLALVRQKIEENRQQREAIKRAVTDWIHQERNLQTRTQAVLSQLNIQPILQNSLNEQLNEISTCLESLPAEPEELKNKLNELISRYYTEVLQNIGALNTEAGKHVATPFDQEKIKKDSDAIEALSNTDALSNLNQIQRHHDEVVSELENSMQQVNTQRPVHASEGELSATAMANSFITDVAYINLYPAANELYHSNWDSLLNYRNKHEVHKHYSEELARPKAVIHRSIGDYEFTVSVIRSSLTQATGFIAKATPEAQRDIKNLQDEIATLYCMIEQTITNVVLSGVPVGKINLRLKGSEAAIAAGAEYARDYFGIRENKISKQITRYPVEEVTSRLLPVPENIGSIVQLLAAKKAGMNEKQPKIAESICELSEHLRGVPPSNIEFTKSLAH